MNDESCESPFIAYKQEVRNTNTCPGALWTRRLRAVKAVTFYTHTWRFESQLLEHMGDMNTVQMGKLTVPLWTRPPFFTHSCN